MDFNLSEDQQAFAQTARQFAESELAPHAAKWDREHIFPKDTIKAAGELGFCGLYTPEDAGGLGLSRLDSSIIFEQLALGCTATTAMLTIHNMATWMVASFGTDAIKDQYVDQLVMGELLASYCLTEPGSGSDAASLKTKAVRDGDEYVINGSKMFISGAGETEVLVVMARTGGEGAAGISAFVVPADAKGVEYGKAEEKMGWNAQPTRLISFEDVRIPAHNLLGAEGAGFKFAMQGLDGGRINIATCSIVAARQMVRLAAFKLDTGDSEKTTYCAMAKRFATDVGFTVCNEALQIHGGYGYIKEYPLERHVRDVRVHQILEGTNEIMRVIIARRILAESASEIL